MIRRMMAGMPVGMSWIIVHSVYCIYVYVVFLGDDGQDDGRDGYRRTMARMT